MKLVVMQRAIHGLQHTSTSRLTAMQLDLVATFSGTITILRDSKKTVRFSSMSRYYATPLPLVSLSERVNPTLDKLNGIEKLKFIFQDKALMITAALFVFSMMYCKKILPNPPFNFYYL